MSDVSDEGERLLSLRLAVNNFYHRFTSNIILLIAFWTIALTIAGYLLVWPIVSVGVVYVWPTVSQSNDERVWRDFERAANRARGTAVVDAEGRYIGVLSSGFERDHLGELSRPETIGGRIIYPDHKTIPVEDAPETFWRCLVYLEDRRRGTWDSPHGVSFRGVIAIPWRAAGASIRARRITLGAGGSTLEMQLARSLWKRYAHNSNPITRKLAEWNAAPVLRRHLGDDANARRLRAWIAQHIALAQSVGDEQDLFGVDAAGRFLFGHGADHLTDAEQMLLAAAVRRPLRLRAGEGRRADEIRRYIGDAGEPGRALRCAADDALAYDGRPVVADAERRADARDELSFMPQRDIPVIHPDLEPFAHDLAEHASGPRYGPQRLAARLAYGVQTEIVGALADALDQRDDRRHPWRGQVTELTLTLDMVANLELGRDISDAVLEIEGAASRASSAGLLRGTIGSPERWEAPFDADSDAARRTPYVMDHLAYVPLTVAVADAEGRIVRLINTGQDANYMGGALQRRDAGYFGNGRYDPDAERRMIGSIGKVAGALLLADAGARDADEVVSNVCPVGVTTHCMNPRTYVGGLPRASYERAFAESLNAAVINALAANVAPSRIDALMRDALRFNLARVERETPRATALTLGRYAGRPRQVHALMMLALAYAREDYDAEVTLPHMIDTWRRFDPETDTFRDDGPVAFPVETLRVSDLVAPGGGAFVRETLSAPICYRARGAHASLRGLREWCADDNRDVALHIAKTGTVPAPSRNGFNESDWWIAGGIEFADGRRYTYVATVGVGDISRPFASELGAGRLAPVIDAVLRDLQAEGEE